jgi:glycerol uptake facilitator protein
MEKKSWIGNYIGEALGVFLIIYFGCGVVIVAIFLGQVPGLVDAALSGAHFNPGVTIALALRRGFPWSQVIPYIISQIVGGFLGAAALFGMYSGIFYDFVAQKGLTIGQPGSQLAAAVFVPYTPHPAIFGTDAVAFAKVTLLQGAWGEFISTALLMMFILALLEKRSVNNPVPWYFPVGLGFAVCMLVFAEAPISMISMNAARDLGPRLFTLLLGFGSIAFPGPRADFWVTTIVPALGAIAGAYFFDFVLLPFFPKAEE